MNCLHVRWRHFHCDHLQALTRPRRAHAASHPAASAPSARPSCRLGCPVRVTYTEQPMAPAWRQPRQVNASHQQAPLDMRGISRVRTQSLMTADCQPGGCIAAHMYVYLSCEYEHVTLYAALCVRSCKAQRCRRCLPLLMHVLPLRRTHNAVTKVIVIKIIEGCSQLRLPLRLLLLLLQEVQRCLIYDDICMRSQRYTRCWCVAAHGRDCTFDACMLCACSSQYGALALVNHAQMLEP